MRQRTKQNILVLGLLGIVSVVTLNTLRLNAQVQYERDVSVYISAPDTFVRGEKAEFVFTVKNEGVQPEAAVTLTDPLAGSFIFVESKNALCSQNDRIVKCEPFTLLPGEEKVITILYTIAPKANCATASVVHTAEVTSANTDDNLENNVAPQVRTKVLCAEEVTESSSSEPEVSLPPPTSSAQKQYTDLVIQMSTPEFIREYPTHVVITVSNTSDMYEPSAQVNFPLLGNFILNQAEGAACSTVGKSIACNYIELQPHTTKQILLTLTVPNKANCTDGSVGLTAYIQGSIEDINEENNTAKVERALVLCGKTAAPTSSASSSSYSFEDENNYLDTPKTSSSSSSSVMSSKANTSSSVASSISSSSYSSASSKALKSSSSSANYQVIRLPDDTSLDPTCHRDQFTQDAGVCINRVVAKHDGSQYLVIFLEANGEYTLKSQSIVLFNREKLYFYGKNVTLKMEEPEIARKVDQYFMVNMFGGSKVIFQGITFDGNNLSGQRGIGICPLPSYPVNAIRIMSTTAKNISDSYVLAGNSHIEYLANDTRFSDIPALNDVRSLPKEDRYCTGDLRNIQFFYNTVEVGTLESQTGFGFYIAPFSTRMTDGVEATAKNWFDLAKNASVHTQNIHIEQNTFLATSNAVNSFIKVQQMENLQVRNNTFNVQDNYRALAKGAAINISANTVNATVDDNTIILTDHQRDAKRAVVVESGFRNHKWYGVGDNGLTSPARNVSVKNNEFINAQARIMNCCQYTVDSTAALCVNEVINEHVSAIEEVHFLQNTTTLPGEPVTLTSEVDAGSLNAQYCRPENPEWR